MDLKKEEDPIDLIIVMDNVGSQRLSAGTCHHYL